MSAQAMPFIEPGTVPPRTVDVVIDTETTGLGHRNRPARPDGVVQVGIAWRDDAGQVSAWSRVCNPGGAFLAGGRAREALELNGRSEAEILKAQPTQVVASELLAQLASIKNGGCTPVRLLAYNRNFDQPFLTSAPWLLPGHTWGPCIMMAATRAINGPDGRYVRLKDAVRSLGLEWPGGRAHDAGADAHAALLVMETLRGDPD